MKTTEDIFRFVSQTIYQTDLRGARAFLSVDAETIAELPPCDLVLLIRCIVLYKQGHHDFPAVALEAVRLVKQGILIKTGAITVIGNTTVAFPSPMHFDLTLHNVLHCRVTLEQNVVSFEGALKEMVLRMNPKLLKDNTRPSVSCQAKTEFGRKFNQCAYLNMYVNNDGLQWGIDMALENDLRNIQTASVRLRAGIVKFQSDNTSFSTSLTRSQTRHIRSCLASRLQRYVYQSYCLSKGPYH